MPAQTMVEKHVKVGKDAGVDEKDTHIKKNQDEVVWDVDDATIIAFESTEGSPFPWKRKNIAAGESFPSGPVRSDAEARGYKYTVYVGSKTNDPTVIVHN